MNELTAAVFSASEKGDEECRISNNKCLDYLQ